MNIFEEDGQIKDELFGTVGILHPAGNYAANEKDIAKPFEWEKAAIKIFCKNCGYTLEISAEEALRLAEKSAINLPPSLEGFYLETDKCVLCSFDKGRVNLKKISNP